MFWRTGDDKIALLFEKEKLNFTMISYAKKVLFWVQADLCGSQPMTGHIDDVIHPASDLVESVLIPTKQLNH